VSRSKADVDELLDRYGADTIAMGSSTTQAVVAFRYANRHVRIVLPMPDRTSRDVTHKRVNQHRGGLVERTQAEQDKAYDQLVRERWRALLLMLKAKLEAVETGLVTFEQEFLAHVQLPDGATVGEWMEPQVARAYELGTMPELLPAARAALPAG
jgi:hypothetical protein